MAKIPCEQQAWSDALELGDRPFVDKVSGIQSRSWFDQHTMNFFVGRGTVLDAVRNDEELAFAHHCLSVAKFHSQRAFDYQKQFIFVFMVVPDEIALEFDGFETTVVHFAENARIPVIGELREFLLEIDRVHDLTSELIRDCERFPRRNRGRAASFPASRSRNRCAGRFPCPTRAPSPSPFHRDKV